jgi:hypothetical protein
MVRLSGGRFVGGGVIMSLLAGDEIGSRSFAFRTTADGAIDGAFGNAGWLLGANGPFDSDAQDLQMEPAGKTIFAGRGSRTADPASAYDVTLARLDDHGQIDLSFAPQGHLAIPFDEDAATLSTGLVRLLRQHDGRLVIVTNRGELVAGGSFRTLQMETVKIALAQVISTPEFSIDATTVRVNESSSTTTVTVTRKGETSTAVSLDYSTSHPAVRRQG